MGHLIDFLEDRRILRRMPPEQCEIRPALTPSVLMAQERRCPRAPISVLPLGGWDLCLEKSTEHATVERRVALSDVNGYRPVGLYRQRPLDELELDYTIGLNEGAYHVVITSFVVRSRR